MTVFTPFFKVIMLCIVSCVLLLYNFLVKNTSHSIYSNFGGSSSRYSTGSQLGNVEVTALPVELENGNIKVGNIMFDPGTILGKGCEGTFVYK